MKPIMGFTTTVSTSMERTMRSIMSHLRYFHMAHKVHHVIMRYFHMAHKVHHVTTTLLTHGT